MIAAIGTDGCDPVVWGLGETEEAAAADARRWRDDDGSGPWDSGGSAYLQVPAEVAERIRAGVIHCATLGIEASRDKDGRITGGRRARSAPPVRAMAAGRAVPAARARTRAGN